MRLSLYLLTIFSFIQGKAQEYEANWSSIDKRPVPQWFADSKFGIFIHWGLYSVPSWGPTADVEVYAKYAEWYWKRLADSTLEGHRQFKQFHDRVYGDRYRYQDFVKDFTCEMFEPDEWARIFEQSGAKYVVLTSKHHDGFAMWPSKHAWNWNAGEVGPHRDLAGDLLKSVRKKGLKMGFYYSLYEWYNPLFLNDKDRYVDVHMLPQMKDLVTTYQPDVLWTDGEWDLPSEKWKSTEFLSWLFNESPVRENVVINDRWGKGTRGEHGGIYTTEYDVNNTELSADKSNHPWEECRGIGTSFGFNRNEYLENYATSNELIHMLIDKVARGGNLLLNIGPTADGRIPVIMQQRLKDIGLWLKVNGEAIYGTRAWRNAPHYNKDTNIFYTKKENDLFVICTKWPEDPIKLSAASAPKKVSILGFNGGIKSAYKNGVLQLIPPITTPNSLPGEHAWVFKVEGFVE